MELFRSVPGILLDIGTHMALPKKKQNLGKLVTETLSQGLSKGFRAYDSSLRENFGKADDQNSFDGMLLFKYGESLIQLRKVNVKPLYSFSLPILDNFKPDFVWSELFSCIVVCSFNTILCLKM